jgi:Glycosyl hydrolase family 30 TIM-barrel domain
MKRQRLGGFLSIPFLFFLSGVPRLEQTMNCGNRIRQIRLEPFAMSKTTCIEKTNKSDGKIDANIDINKVKEVVSIEGKGFTLTEATATNIMSLDKEQREDYLKHYFVGLNMNTIMTNIGPTDFSNDFETYTEENGVCEIDSDVCEVIKLILKIQPSVKIIAKSYSPPPKMKTTKDIGSGRLKTEFEQDYARYLSQYINQMFDLGANNIAIAIQNEPTVGSEKKPILQMYPATLMDQLQYNRLSKYIKLKYGDSVEVIGFNDTVTQEKIKVFDPNSVTYADRISIHGYHPEAGFTNGSNGLDTKLNSSFFCGEFTELNQTNPKKAFFNNGWAIRNMINCYNSGSALILSFNGVTDQNNGPLPKASLYTFGFRRGCAECSGLNILDNKTKKLSTTTLHELFVATREIKLGSKVLETPKINNLLLSIVQNKKSLSILGYNTSGSTKHIEIEAYGEKSILTIEPNSPVSFLILDPSQATSQRELQT